MPLSAYSRLDPVPVRETIVRLANRVAERFPQSGLSRVTAELVEVAVKNEEILNRLRRPIWWVRAFTIAGIVAVVAVIAWALLQIEVGEENGRPGFADLVQAVEAATNELIFLAIALFFLTSLESRFKRRVALQMLHRLRSIAHVVDMHQLTKDPEQVLHRDIPTPSSPARTLGRHDLARYLEYCSETLALISKLAALHNENIQDAVILEAVNDIESLTDGLSRKVWQKITILDIAAAETA